MRTVAIIGTPSPRTRASRLPQRVAYDRATIDAILDEALVSHLGFSVDEQPYVIPTLHARIGDTLYFHGSAASRTLRAIAGGAPACLTVTLLDGLVLARSAFNHSVNYRSVLVFGNAQLIDDVEQRRAALHAFMDKVAPGRWDEVRQPSDRELRVTSILAMPLTEASAKLRSGPPTDEPEDHGLDVWAGVIPLALRAEQPLADPQLRAGLEPSAVVERWSAEHS